MVRHPQKWKAWKWAEASPTYILYHDLPTIFWTWHFLRVTKSVLTSSRRNFAMAGSSLSTVTLRAALTGMILAEKEVGGPSHDDRLRKRSVGSKMTKNWVVVSNIFIFPSLPREMIQFDEHVFQMGWNHQKNMEKFGELGFSNIKKVEASFGWSLSGPVLRHCGKSSVVGDVSTFEYSGEEV